MTWHSDQFPFQWLLHIQIGRKHIFINDKISFCVYKNDILSLLYYFVCSGRCYAARKCRLFSTFAPLVHIRIPDMRNLILFTLLCAVIFSAAFCGTTVPLSSSGPSLRLLPDSSAPVLILSHNHYGGSPVLRVEAGEIYNFECPAGQQWKDWYVSSGPDGYSNPLLLLSGRRLKGVKCFTLCGAVGKSEEHLFRIGHSLTGYQVPVSGDLYFFANDAWKFYGNNKGEMRVKVTRKQ